MTEPPRPRLLAPSLRLADLSKSFGPVSAVRGVSIEFEAKKIHAVVGENGAGKSTLLKMAAGIAAPDAGEVSIDGRVLAPHSAAEAIARGVAMVQQHFALIGVFTALENVVLGHEPTGALGRIDFAAARARVTEITRELGVALPLDALTETLGVGDRQRLEIARALYRDARIVILDEPTAVLTPAEADQLYETLRRLADAGRTIVVVTHKLDEVRAHADVVSVMRKGELVSTRPFDGPTRPGDAEMRAVAEAMMGDGRGAAFAPHVKARPTSAPAGDPVLAVHDLRRAPTLRGVTLAVRAGEICGIAGVEGNGQRELVRLLAGLDVQDRGTIDARGELAVVHEDRHHEGLVLDASVRENVVLGELARFAKLGWLDRGAIEAVARARVKSAGVTPPSLDAPARALSGGNQQKIVVERAIARTKLEPGAKSLVLAHPTRGVDLGAARAIHDAVLACAARGVAVLVLSADLAELRLLCDRILVIARGAIVAELPPSASDRDLGAAMLGAAPRDAGGPLDGGGA